MVVGYVEEWWGVWEGGGVCGRVVGCVGGWWGYVEEWWGVWEGGIGQWPRIVSVLFVTLQL